MIQRAAIRPLEKLTPRSTTGLLNSSIILFIPSMAMRTSRVQLYYTGWIKTIEKIKLITQRHQRIEKLIAIFYSSVYSPRSDLSTSHTRFDSLDIPPTHYPSSRPRAPTTPSTYKHGKIRDGKIHARSRL